MAGGPKNHPLFQLSSIRFFVHHSAGIKGVLLATKNTRKLLATFLAILGAAALSFPSATSAGPAIIGFTGGGPITSYSDQLFGWQFTLSSAVNVTALGVFDPPVYGGLAVAHDVGIFRVSDKSLVVSATLSSGLSGFADGDFRYQSLSTDVGLPAGDYVIVMTVPAQNIDDQVHEATAVTTAPEITYIRSALDISSTLAYPVQFGLFEKGFFGPNFQFNPVPEPSSLALLGFGLFGLVLSTRRASSCRASKLKPRTGDLIAAHGK
jgi:hypothetical protein